MNYAEQAAEKIDDESDYRTSKMEAIIQDAIDKATADSESHRARAVEALIAILNHCDGNISIGGSDKKFISSCVNQALSNQPPSKTGMAYSDLHD